MGATVAAKNKKIREEALREQLRQKGLHSKVIDIANKLDDQHLELESSQIQALRASAEIRLKLINKYMPDLKAVEMSQDPENPVADMSNTDLNEAIKALTAKLDESE